MIAHKPVPLTRATYDDDFRVDDSFATPKAKAKAAASSKKAKTKAKVKVKATNARHMLDHVLDYAHFDLLFTDDPSTAPPAPPALITRAEVGSFRDSCLALAVAQAHHDGLYCALLHKLAHGVPAERGALKLLAEPFSTI